MRARIVAAVLPLATAAFAPVSVPTARAADTTPFELEAKIPLGEVVGRIDHMAIDLRRHRLFVAELGNSSVSAVDLAAREVVRRIGGFEEPQGLGYAPRTDALYVASGGDGSVRVLKGPDLTEAARIDLGDDADNVRIEAAERRVWVGYGRGGLTAIDVETQRKVADIALDAHPEGFRLDPSGERIFANLPDAHAVAVVDRKDGALLAKWPTGRLGGNFPMALDEARRQVLVVFRAPARLVAFSMDGGAIVSGAATCADSDDVFVDAKRRRIYVSCGEGYLDVFEAEEGIRRIGHIQTVSGARTSLFVPELDRLFLAVRARSGQAAAIWVYRPLP